MALEDHLGKSLADLAETYLFKPLGMNYSTMRQPHEAGFLTNVAQAHDENGQIIRTGTPITPQVAPSGLWSTPLDIAIFIIEFQRALAGQDTKVISQAVAQSVVDVVTLKVMGGWSMGWGQKSNLLYH